jgi:hypothetical protein
VGHIDFCQPGSVGPPPIDLQMNNYKKVFQSFTKALDADSATSAPPAPPTPSPCLQARQKPSAIIIEVIIAVG